DDDAHYVAVARFFTTVFAVLMIVIAGAFAYAKVNNPNVRIIPVVLGVAGFIVGPMLGVFLVGMFTKSRGSDFGNMLAITAGLITTIVLGGLYIDLINLVGPAFGMQAPVAQPSAIPKVSFTWFALIGATVVFLIGVIFKTPPDVIVAAERKRAEAGAQENQPLALRGANVEC